MKKNILIQKISGFRHGWKMQDGKFRLMSPVEKEDMITGDCTGKRLLTDLKAAQMKSGCLFD
ncbi:hypothetical protein ABET51_00325 [Metabacillus fastidiosus]|uniref:hypothetical protein n=1 Tax=Metabacillus fastidiosus TaxID=1458 RepID=UPI003D28366E